MKAIRATYTLRDGTCGVLHVLARNTCDGVLCAIDAFGEQLHTCSARTAAPRLPAHPPTNSPADLQPHRS